MKKLDSVIRKHRYASIAIKKFVLKGFRKSKSGSEEGDLTILLLQKNNNSETQDHSL